MDRPPDPQGRHRRGVRQGRPDRPGRLPPGRDRARADRDAGRARSCPSASGRLTIYSCTQALYFSMGVVAAHLQLPLNKLKFVGGTVGGGFGGKVDTATETICALLALKSGRPVKWRWTREEEFLCSSTRAPWHMEIADAVTKDGWILGRKMLTLHDSGAYARFSPVRRDEAQLPPHRRVHDPEPRVRRLRRLHEPRADDGDARLRRHLGLVRDRDAPEPHRARCSASTRSSCGSRTRTGSATRRRTGSRTPIRRRCRRSSRSPTRSGTSCRAEYRTMTRDPRTGDLLPEHLVAPARKPGGSLMAKHTGRGIRGDRVPDRHEPERRPVAGLDQGQAGRPRRRLRRHRPTSATARRRSRRRSSPRRSASRTSGSPTTTRTPTRRRSAPARSPRARRSSPARPSRRRAESVRAEDPRDRRQGARDRPGRPRDRRRRGDRQGRAAEEDQRPRRRRRGDLDATAS